jgi:regulation of enolase protein 1 (concanavalin A-like superfamily)
MSWPLSQDYNEAIQDPNNSFSDAELRTGEAVTNALGIPMPRSGNFADVYEVRCPSGARWAVKCFTREVHGLRERYHEISKYLSQVNLPFMVDFQYLEQGIRVRGAWFPVLKMQWVEGFVLNEFVRDNLDKKPILQALGQIWLRMARRLREANLAHCDLQHGNVLFVPGSSANSLAVKLIDYDGMCVPALAGVKSGEVGHPAYQHPERLRTGAYNQEVDRFSLLAIAAGLRCLTVGGRSLWERYDNGDNLLFRQSDLQAPTQSPLFQELLAISDPQAQMLVKELYRACQGPLAAVPLLTELLPEEKPAGKVTAVRSAAHATQLAAAQGPDWDFGDDESITDVVQKRKRAERKMPLWAWGALGGAAAVLLLCAGVGTALVLRNGSTAKDETPVAQNRPDVKPPVKPPDAKPPQQPANEKGVDANPPANPNPQPGHPQLPDDGDLEQLLPTRVFQRTPDGQKLAINRAGANIWHLVHPRTGAKQQEFKGHTAPITGLAFSADGRRALTAARDKTMRVWDTQTGELLRTLDTGSQVIALALSADGKKAISSDISPDSKFAIMWDLETGKRINSFQNPRRPISLAFSPNGESLLCGFERSRENDMRVLVLWPLVPNRFFVEFRAHPVPITCVAVSPDGKYVASGHSAETRCVCLWEASSGRLLWQAGMPEAPITQVAFSPDSRALLGTTRHHVQLWRVGPRAESLGQRGDLTHDLLCAAFRPDSRSAVFSLCKGDTIVSSSVPLPAAAEVVVAQPSGAGWDPPVDPQRDCQFADGGGKLTITVPGKGHDLAADRGNMSAPRLLRDIEGDFTAQVRVSGDYAVPDGTPPWRGAGLLLFRDDKNYVRLERALGVLGKDRVHAIWQMHRDGLIASKPDFPALPPGAIFLRMERRGDKLLGAYSEDGTKWTELKLLDIELPRKVKIGVAAWAAASRFAPMFDQFQLRQGQGQMERINQWLTPVPAVAVQPAAASWDAPVDPDGDCKFQSERGRLTITVPGKPHDLRVDQGNKNAPRLLRSCEGDFTVQVHVDGDFSSSEYRGAGLLLWAGEKTYFRMERAETINRKRLVIERMKDGQRILPGMELPLSAAACDLQIKRSGKQLFVSYSEEKGIWHGLAPLDFELPAKIKIGVIAVSTSPAPFAPTFEQFQLQQGQGPMMRLDQWLTPTGTVKALSGGWEYVDPLGDCKFQSAGDELTFTVPGKGHDLRADQGHSDAPRLMRSCEGDFTAQVHVGGDFAGSEYRGAGLLLWVADKTYIRLEHAETVAGPQIAFRVFQDGQTPPGGFRAISGATESYLKMERQGRKITIWFSNDGRGWSGLPALDLDLPAKVKIGVAAVSTCPTPFSPTLDQFQLKQGQGELARVDWPSNSAPGGEQVVVKPPKPAPRPARPRRNRMAAPGENQLADARKQVRVMYRDAYKDKSKRALATHLYEESQRQGDFAVRYTMLTESRQAAAQAGDFATALRAVTRLCEQFADEPLELKCRAAEETLPAVTSKVDYRALTQKVLLLIDRALIDERYDVADRLLKVARAAADKADMSTILKKAVEHSTKQLDSQRAEYEAVKSAAEKLESNPEDEEASLALGKFRCLTRDDWGGGLPLLEHGNDPALRELARKDLAVAPDDASAHVAVGDAWFDRAGKAAGKEKAAYLRRAYYLYKDSVADVDRLDRKEQAHVKQQLAQLTAQLPELARPFADLDFSGPTVSRKTGVNLLHLGPHQVVATRRLYRGPIDIRVTAAIPKGHIRISFLGGGEMTLDPDNNNYKVRIYYPFGSDADERGGLINTGFGRSVAGPLQEVRMQVRLDGWSAFVNNQVVGGQGGSNVGAIDYMPAPVRVWSDDGELDIKSIVVKPTR